MVPNIFTQSPTVKKLATSLGMHPKKVVVKFRERFRRNRYEGQRYEGQIDINMVDLPSVKTLGIIWSASSNQFSFSAVPLVENIVLTKRKFLSKTSTLFDLMGFVTPFVVRVKSLMQEVWVSGIDWYDQSPENILDKAKKWFAELQDLRNLKIGRWLRRSTSQVVADQSFHVFSSASSDAYAAAMYERNVYEDGSVSVSFISSKSKVASLNANSTPRLELLGTILGLQLCQVVSKVLGDHVMKKFSCFLV